MAENYITLENVSKSFGEKELFSVSLLCYEWAGDRHSSLFNSHFTAMDIKTSILL